MGPYTGLTPSDHHSTMQTRWTLYYRLMLIAIGIVIWWQLISTSNEVSPIRNIRLIDNQHVFSSRYRTSLIGAETTRLELHDLAGKLVSSRTIKGGYIVRSFGAAENGEIAIALRKGTGNLVLSLLDRTTLQPRVSREFPNQPVAAIFSRRGKHLVFAQWVSESTQLRMLSTKDLRTVDQLTVVPGMSSDILGPAFAFAGDQIIWYEDGVFRTEPGVSPRGHPLYCYSVAGDAMLVETLAPSHNGAPAGSEYEFPDRKIAIYWPASRRMVELSGDDLLSQDQLLDNGNLLLRLESDFESNQQTQTMTSPSDGAVYRLFDEPSYRIYRPTLNLFREHLQKEGTTSSFDRLRLWDGKTGQQLSTTDFTAGNEAKFILLVVIASLWCCCSLYLAARYSPSYLTYAIVVAMACSILETIAFVGYSRGWPPAQDFFGTAQLVLVAFVCGRLVDSNTPLTQRTVEAAFAFAFIGHSIYQLDLRYWQLGEKEFCIGLALLGCWTILAVSRCCRRIRADDEQQRLDQPSEPTSWIPRFRVVDLLLLMAAIALSFKWAEHATVFTSADFWSQPVTSRRFLGSAILLCLQATAGMLLVFGSKWHRLLGVALVLLVISVIWFGDEWRSLRHFRRLAQGEAYTMVAYLSLLLATKIYLWRAGSFALPSTAGPNKLPVVDDARQ